MAEDFLSVEHDAVDPGRFTGFRRLHKSTSFRGLDNPIQGTVFGLDNNNCNGPNRIGSMNSLDKQIALRGLSPGALEQQFAFDKSIPHK